MGKLTEVGIESLRDPGRYPDGDGLYILVGPKGAKSWMLRIQVDHRRRDLGLGSYANRTLAQARGLVTELRNNCRAHGFSEKTTVELVEEFISDASFSYILARNTIPTFREAAIQLHTERLPSWKNLKHRVEWLRSLESYVFPFLGNIAVDAVDGPAIREVLARIWLAKPETARRVRQRIGAVLGWSCAMGFRASVVPMQMLSMTLPRQPRRGHFEAMHYTEVPTFLAVIRAGRPSMGRLALEALILTAARSGEVRGAHWGEIDRQAAVWTIPAERMKAGVKHIVPLSKAALEAFDRAAAYQLSSAGLIFPGKEPSERLSATTLLDLVHETSDSVTVHGFRSSFCDWVAEETTYSGEVAAAALAHTISNKAEAAYRRTNFLTRRRMMMADWAVYCGGKTPISSIE